MISFSFGVITRLFRSGPAITRRGQERRFVHEVREVRAGESGRLPCQHAQLDILLERLALRVDLEDHLPSAAVWPVEDHLAVEAPRPQQRRVEDVRAVCRRDDDHIRVRVEAVHLDEDLVQCLFSLVVRAAQAGAALASHGVDLIYEDDAR